MTERGQYSSRDRAKQLRSDGRAHPSSGAGKDRGRNSSRSKGRSGGDRQ